MWPIWAKISKKAQKTCYQKSETTLPSEPFQNLQLSLKKLFSKTHESKNLFSSVSKADNEQQLKFWPERGQVWYWLFLLGGFLQPPPSFWQSVAASPLAVTALVSTWTPNSFLLALFLLVGFLRAFQELFSRFKQISLKELFLRRTVSKIGNLKKHIQKTHEKSCTFCGKNIPT